MPLIKIENVRIIHQVVAKQTVIINKKKNKKPLGSGKLNQTIVTYDTPVSESHVTFSTNFVYTL